MTTIHPAAAGSARLAGRLAAARRWGKPEVGDLTRVTAVATAAEGIAEALARYGVGGLTPADANFLTERIALLTDRETAA